MKCLNRESCIWKALCLRRNILTLLVFFSYFNMYILRINLSIGVVGMNANYSREVENGTIIYVKDVDWNSIEKGYVLSAYFYGYIFTPLFGGFLAYKFGGVQVLGIGLLCTSLLTLATPYVAMINIYATIALRVLVGIFEGVTFPSISTVFSRWSPVHERTRMCSIAMCGCPVGTFFVLITGGILTENFGWSFIFYFTGGLGIMYSVIWLIFAKNQPADDPWILREELMYIEKSVGVVNYGGPIPWKSIFKSIPVLVLALANFSEAWGYCTLYTQLPTFYSDVFHQDVKHSGILSSFSFMAAPIILILSAYTADKIIEKHLLTITQVRKIWLVVPLLSQALFTLLASYSENQTVAMLLFTVSVSLGYSSQTTFGSNILDLSPAYVGILCGISAMSSILASIIAPTYSGYITTNKTIGEWRIVFFTSCVFYIIGTAMYAIFGNGEVQKWNTVSRRSNLS